MNYFKAIAAWEFHPKTKELKEECARLHEELAKANGACFDMSRELNGLLKQLEAVEATRDALQELCERLEAKLSAQSPL